MPSDRYTKKPVTVEAIQYTGANLRVWWIPQMPMEAFYVPVESLAQAKWLLSVLADYDAFQFENCIKPDYCNAGGLQVREDGSWLEWMDPETGDDIDSWDPAARPIDTAELERLAASLPAGDWVKLSGMAEATVVPSTQYDAFMSGALIQGDLRIIHDGDPRDPISVAIAEAIALLPALLREVLARRKAEAWQPETNILPWVALTIEQMRRFEASSGDLERLGLNGEWIPTDTPLSPGLVYRIKPTPTTEASHDE